MIYAEVKQSLNVLRYLKYVKTAKGGKRGRMINIILCSMQLISPLCTEIVLIIAISQTPALSMIIKSFVALAHNFGDALVNVSILPLKHYSLFLNNFDQRVDWSKTW